MKKYYFGISERMLSEIATISEQMSHQGEKGKNNELVLTKFLDAHLPKQYSVSTGKVISASERTTESDQTDVIIHDRLYTPALIDAQAWSLVPIESTYAVISVKTTLDKKQLHDAINQVASVRKLPKASAINYDGSKKYRIADSMLLRPRGFVFSFKSNWKKSSSVDTAFKELLDKVPDKYRPNAVCILDKCLIIRKPNSLETIIYEEYPLLHFFGFLQQAIDSFFPRTLPDLAQYFEKYPG